MDSWNKPPSKPPWNKKTPQPNIDEVLNNLQSRFKMNFQGKNFSILILLAALALWLSTGFFIVEPAEQAVVKRFGKFHRIEDPGPHLALPKPIETRITENVQQVRRIEIGFRTSSAGSQARTVRKESLMLTGDENILDVQFIVQYRIANLPDYVFKITDPLDTVRAASESAMREVIGRTSVDDALTTGKDAIEQSTRNLLQEILDNYRSGVNIEIVKLQDVHPPDQVKEAFKDVASAKEDREKMINEAQGYRNNLIPKARGEATKILNEALAYAEQTVLIAEGKAKRFTAVYEEYRSAKEITKQRIRIETMESILPQVRKVIADPQMGNNVLPFLPLQDLGKLSNSGNQRSAQ